MWIGASLTRFLTTWRLWDYDVDEPNLLFFLSES